MKKWKCGVCGYVHTGAAAPDKCPVCGVPGSKFAEITGEEGKSLKDYVNAQIEGETWEVTHYLAAALLADKLGYANVAETFRTIAMEEAYHGANYLYRSGEIGKTKEDLKEFVAKMIEAEKGAHKMKTEGFSLALSEGQDELAAFFKISAEDEARHASMWSWAYKELEK
ncbi:reverse rubrerythrin-2 [Oxobacter pfennigii]|uniref:Reverse rubrerythrin-2 n=1 Tax=Oxobacter pfennigii TaxID=36849 RepID=A0A0P8WMA6_9CLOT|nr:ferritin family protein [Oxobacter pfennigii]KPU43646.1 reverse rubrerythrin-2 [Oxobacter pfennigii]